jgi:Ion channel
VSAIVTALLVTTPFLVLRRVLHHPRITLATVAGGLCAYLLVGFAFASLYRTISLVEDDAFTPALESASTYFSFVTLTTTGFGDYVATSDITRSLVMLEAIIGQVLLVTLVARFVSTLGQERGEPPRREPLPPRD